MLAPMGGGGKVLKLLGPKGGGEPPSSPPLQWESQIVSVK